MISIKDKNQGWLIAGFMITQGLLILSIALGVAKSYAELEWVDVAGEGGASVLLALWWWFLLNARPAGRVSNFLIAGLLLVFLGQFQDTLDEFIRWPDSASWLANLESIFVPCGMVVLTFGLFLWKQEQEVISAQLANREGHYRDHTAVDKLTQLADIRYLKDNLDIYAQQSKSKQSPFSLILIDLDDFHRVNREYGINEGDRLLQFIAEMLMLNLNSNDLICHFAGDRFALLLENTNQSAAELLLQDCLNVVNHYTYRTQLGERIAVRASGGLACFRDESVDELLQRAKIDLLKAKEIKRTTTSAA